MNIQNKSTAFKTWYIEFKTGKPVINCRCCGLPEFMSHAKQYQAKWYCTTCGDFIHAMASCMPLPKVEKILGIK